MSYILEALRRAEQERALGRVPDAAALVAPVAPSPYRYRFPPWLIVTLALLLNAGVLFAIFGVNWKTVAPAPASSTAVPVTASSAPVPPPAGRVPSPPPPATVPSAPAAAAPPVPVAGVPSARPAGNPEAAAAPSAPVTAVAPPAVPVPAAVPPPPVRPPKVDTPTVKAPEAVARSRPPPASAKPPLPGIEAMPGLNLNIHVYSEVRSERFVMINSRRYKEGERLDEGPMVERIEPDGVVLSERGKRFVLEVPR